MLVESNGWVGWGHIIVNIVKWDWWRYGTWRIISLDKYAMEVGVQVWSLKLKPTIRQFGRSAR